MLAFWVSETSETLYESAMLCGVEFHLNCAFLFTHRLIEFIKRSTPTSEELLWVKVFHPYSIRTIADGFISFHKHTKNCKFHFQLASAMIEMKSARERLPRNKTDQPAGGSEL